jgi:hypothetical protein
LPCIKKFEFAINKVVFAVNKVVFFIGKFVCIINKVVFAVNKVVCIIGKFVFVVNKVVFIGRRRKPSVRPVLLNQPPRGGLGTGGLGAGDRGARQTSCASASYVLETAPPPLKTNTHRKRADAGRACFNARSSVKNNAFGYEQQA